MKAKLIKELHEVGVFRDPQTKRKLETMKISEILQVRDMIKEEMEKGIVHERKQGDYEFVTVTKKVKVDKKKRK